MINYQGKLKEVESLLSRNPQISAMSILKHQRQVVNGRQKI